MRAVTACERLRLGELEAQRDGIDSYLGLTLTPLLHTSHSHLHESGCGSGWLRRSATVFIYPRVNPNPEAHEHLTHPGPKHTLVSKATTLRIITSFSSQAHWGTRRGFARLRTRCGYSLRRAVWRTLRGLTRWGQLKKR